MDVERLRRLASEGDWWAQHELRREERRRETRTMRDLAALIRRAEGPGPSIDDRIEAAREAVRLADDLGVALVPGRRSRRRDSHLAGYAGMRVLHLRHRAAGIGCEQSRGLLSLARAADAAQQMVGGLVCRACMRSLEGAR